MNRSDPDLNSSTRSRIPSTLQAVFLASNRGNEVDRPPPNQVASKVYPDNWCMQGKSSSSPSLNARCSVNASIRNENKKELCRVPAEGDNKPPKRGRDKQTKSIPPQAHLDTLLRSRGYSTQRFHTLQTSYFNKPTPLQLASYSTYMIELVRKGDVKTLENIMACGISPNPCNRYGESLVHNVCRRGDHKILDIFVRYGCALNVSDDYGRTPLHDACWAPEPAFEVVRMIMEKDIRLFRMIDARDYLPLGYIREKDWPKWVNFLESVKDTFWPIRSSDDDEDDTSRFTQLGPDSCPLPDPRNAATVELAKMVTSGQMSPKEAKLLLYLGGDYNEPTEDMSESVHDDFASSSDFDSEYDSDDKEYSDDLDMDEMEDLLEEMSALRSR